MLEKLLAPFLGEAATIIERYPPDFALRALTSHLLKILIDAAIKRGPSDGFAERMGLAEEPEKAQAIYAAVLADALTHF